PARGLREPMSHPPSEDWYDRAQICRNGHIVTIVGQVHPEQLADFCSSCGEPTMTTCLLCQEPIRGAYHKAFTGFAFYPPYRRPSFCPSCGSPYPWTEEGLKSARALADELENLSQEEKESLKESLGDVVRETPATPAAAKR